MATLTRPSVPSVSERKTMKKFKGPTEMPNLTSTKSTAVFLLPRPPRSPLCSSFCFALQPELLEMRGSHSLCVVISIDLSTVQQPFPADFLTFALPPFISFNSPPEPKSSIFAPLLLCCEVYTALSPCHRFTVECGCNTQIHVCAHTHPCTSIIGRYNTFSCPLT